MSVERPFGAAVVTAFSHQAGVARAGAGGAGRGSAASRIWAEVAASLLRETSSSFGAAAGHATAIRPL